VKVANWQPFTDAASGARPKVAPRPYSLEPPKAQKVPDLGWYFA
jgi:hypothetical protein